MWFGGLVYDGACSTRRERARGQSAESFDEHWNDQQSQPEAHDSRGDR